VGEIIKMTVRSSDIACRYGGEEFVVATPETKLAEAGKLAERLRETIGSVSCQRGGQPHLGDCQRRGIHPSRRRRRAIILGSRGPSSLPSESGRSQPR
ncbi:MAG TPA: diguanylate cyclase, partial [Candidatus Binataceae bacterium]|nr:diguanylate cyclase [Candidatus Binataceae bacterium]